MLEDRIIVQDRGIDAGLAALMQNANRGNMDPAALMAMMNNNGMGGNGGWWWIWIILLFFCWGGNGFGFGGRNAGALASELNTDANTNLLMLAINGNKDAINNLATTLNCDINSVQTALNTINTGVSQISCDTKLASCEVINAITSGNASLASQLASCCCDLRQEVCGINNNITRMGYENQLANCNQTNTLQNAITSGFNSLMADNASKFNIIGSKIDAQTQIINDKFCQLEMREMQNKIEALRDEKQAYQLSASQLAQTANIVNQIRPCPVPAYLTCNPFGCNGGFSGYGYGYGEGCNC
ncbi:spike protein/glycoprotein [uncultured phage cr125_1]|uniref:Spike protein/glycoprotein n=1 Tax=uncultured phage cr125_1 TaxID=2772091 RepID=A0A7M1RTU9_9CAUD|nr:spike protein/glycoprotein [uncultured phage cr125_1]QOR57544.1 spike protein/glycoprotein [uncultured phage cr125_1]